MQSQRITLRGQNKLLLTPVITSQCSTASVLLQPHVLSLFRVCFPSSQQCNLHLHITCMSASHFCYCATLLSDRYTMDRKMAATNGAFGPHSPTGTKGLSSNPCCSRRPQSAKMMSNGLDSLITPGSSALSSSWHPGLQSSRVSNVSVLYAMTCYCAVTTYRVPLFSVV